MPSTRNKRQIEANYTSMKIFDTNNKKVIKTLIDNENNIFFVTNSKIFKLKNNEIISNEVNGVDGINDAIITGNDDIYIKTNEHKLYFLFKNSITAKQWVGHQLFNQLINEFSLKKKNNNIYFTSQASAILVLEPNQEYDQKAIYTTPFRYFDSIFFDNDENVYCYEINLGLYLLKKDEIEFRTFSNLLVPNGFPFHTPNFIKINNIIANDNKVNLINIDKNNNIYLRANNEIYILMNNQITAIKIDGLISGNIESTCCIGNKMYFKINNGLYLIENGNTLAKKIEEINEQVNYILQNENDLYIATNNGFYILKPDSSIPEKNNQIYKNITFIAIDNQKNLYLIFENELNLLEKETNMMTVIFRADSIVYSIIIDRNNNIYFKTNDGFHILTDAKQTRRIFDNNKNSFKEKLIQVIMNKADEVINNNQEKIETIIIDLLKRKINEEAPMLGYVILDSQYETIAEKIVESTKSNNTKTEMAHLIDSMLENIITK